MKLNLTTLLVILLASIWVGQAQSHFLWLVPADESGAKVTLYFSEGPEPDNPEMLKRVSSVRAVPYRTEKPNEPVGFEFEESNSRLVAKHAGASAWSLSHTFGTHGRDEKNLIVYSAASVACRRPGMGEKDAVSLPLIGYTAEPTFDGKTLSIRVWDNEKPAADIAVELQSPNDHRSLRTDNDGRIAIQDIETGVYAIRCLQVDNTPGEHEGVAYKAVKKYSTVSFLVPTMKKFVATEASELGKLPEAITSFGATAIGETIFAYGGHTGGAHSYSNDEQFNKLIRFNRKTSKAWETIAEGPRVQGNALVAFENSVILVGGFTAENAKGEKSRLVSQSGVKKFDLHNGTWSEMPSLPEPRSSMDATVLDGYLYAVGGWSMTGESDETKWLKTAWRLRLGSEQTGWQPIAEPPFQRRALAVASHAGRVFVIGGMNAEGGPTTETCAYNPANNSWEVLGSISGVPMNGFGAAATDFNGKLLVSTVDGSIQEFNDELGIWTIAGQVPTGRFFHRMLPVSNNTVGIFGGANMNVGKFREAEFVTTSTK